MMNLLAIDTATEHFSVALACGKSEHLACGKGEHLACGKSDPSADWDTWVFEADAGLRHSELVMDSIDMLMHKAALKPADLSGIVCMGGPGSFTGLRIGFAIAKGLALSLNIPFFAIPTLDCLAWPFSAWPGIVIPAIDAKKGAFFCALYRSGMPLTPAMDAAPEAIARAIADAPPPHQALLIGPAAPLLHTQLKAVDASIDLNPGKALRWGNAETLLRMARETGVIGSAADYSAGPVYIRKSDAEMCLGNNEQVTGNR